MAANYNKLVLLVAAMAALMVAATATRGQMGTIQQCRRQLRGGEWPDRCQQYLMQSMRGGGGSGSRGGGRGYGGIQDDDEEENYHEEGQGFEKCCQELRMMQPKCQCEAMKMMMEDMSESQSERMSERIMHAAMRLPKTCGTMQERCHMSSYM